MIRLLDVASSLAASIARGVAGMRVEHLGPRPERPLQLYDFEGCPYCRKVREALSILDLDAQVFPCPKGGTLFRPEVRHRGGKEQFPFLVDPNTGKEMYESAEIVQYLFATYGLGGVPWVLAWDQLVNVTSGIASLFRLGRGTYKTTSRIPEEPLEVWSFEASPYCRIVREALSSLEIPYLLHNVARGSQGRPEFVERSGKMMVPYLSDPNTGAEMFESSDIVRYLNEIYGRPSSRKTERTS
jgi:glutathione S-transferase